MANRRYYIELYSMLQLFKLISRLERLNKLDIEDPMHLAAYSSMFDFFRLILRLTKFFSLDIASEIEIISSQLRSFSPKNNLKSLSLGRFPNSKHKDLWLSSDFFILVKSKVRLSRLRQFSTEELSIFTWDASMILSFNINERFIKLVSVEISSLRCSASVTVKKV